MPRHCAARTPAGNEVRLYMQQTFHTPLQDRQDYRLARTHCWSAERVDHSAILLAGNRQFRQMHTRHSYTLKCAEGFSCQSRECSMRRRDVCWVLKGCMHMIDVWPWSSNSTRNACATGTAKKATHKRALRRKSDKCRQASWDKHCITDMSTLNQDSCLIRVPARTTPADVVRYSIYNRIPSEQRMGRSTHFCGGETAWQTRAVQQFC